MSALDTAAVNPRCIKTLSANGLIKFSVYHKTVFSNGQRSLSRNPPDFIILDSPVFHNLILADKSFAKSLQSFGTCRSANNNLYG